MGKSYNLTADDAKELICYITMSAGYRKNEAEAWDELAQKMAPDGTPKYPKAAGNARYFRSIDARLKEIVRKLES